MWLCTCYTSTHTVIFKITNGTQGHHKKLSFLKCCEMTGSMDLNETRINCVEHTQVCTQTCIQVNLLHRKIFPILVLKIGILCTIQSHFL